MSFDLQAALLNQKEVCLDGERLKEKEKKKKKKRRRKKERQIEKERREYPSKGAVLTLILFVFCFLFPSFDLAPCCLRLDPWPRSVFTDVGKKVTTHFFFSLR